MTTLEELLERFPDLKPYKTGEFIDDPEDVIAYIEVYAEYNEVAKTISESEGFRKLKELVNASRQP